MFYVIGITVVSDVLCYKLILVVSDINKQHEKTRF